MRNFWLGWALVGLVVELYTVAAGKTTLSATWFWARDLMPLPLALLVSGALGGLFVWLLSVHWIFSGLDRPGFDWLERGLVVIGLVVGAAGAAVSKPRKGRHGDEA